MVAEQHERRDRLRRNRNELVLVANEIAQLELRLRTAGNRARVEVDLANLLTADGQVIMRAAVIPAADGCFAVELEVARPGRFAVAQIDGAELVLADKNDFAFVNAADK